MSEEHDKRKGPPRWLVWVIGIALVAFAMLLAALFFSPLRDEYFPRTYRFPFPKQQVLDEAVAIEMSRKGLEAARIDLTGATPMPFYPDKPTIYMLNGINPNSGQVQWKVPSVGTPRRTHFSVTVERVGSEIVVTLGENWL
ncbi:MAG: hypothetical protein RL514_3961 [Verrucomicrobiota bacterium]|jgi:hypothetical protein